MSPNAIRALMGNAALKAFDRYCDPDNASFGTLGVFNVDTLVPGGVWPMHPHRDIEVITYCLDGAFQHADQHGKGGILYPRDKPMTFLQIWILLRQRGMEPSVEQRQVKREERLNRLVTLVTDKNPQALPIQQDAEFLVAALEPDKVASHPLAPGYGAYLYVASGEVDANRHKLPGGDAAKIVAEPTVAVKAVQDSELAMVVVPVS